MANRRLGITQNEGRKKIAIINLINQKPIEERENKELVAGSNDEKISVIIY